MLETDASPGDDLDGVGREDVDRDFEVLWVAEFDQALAGLDDGGALLENPQHTAVDGGGDLEAVVVLGIGGFLTGQQ